MSTASTRASFAVQPRRGTVETPERKMGLHPLLMEFDFHTRRCTLTIVDKIFNRSHHPRLVQDWGSHATNKPSRLGISFTNQR